ncbi:Uncharacterized protein APZ42_020141 [Daphnia magna]|uniref:Uncharacterized protein n=1 Tax=Daphnia magna TaxID=35525 RepID=A0A164Y0R9_9CRUS|nr:Uncharacterized protein APZ42_020141 [Daphnia magna]
MSLHGLGALTTPYRRQQDRYTAVHKLQLDIYKYTAYSLPKSRTILLVTCFHLRSFQISRRSAIYVSI